MEESVVRVRNQMLVAPSFTYANPLLGLFNHNDVIPKPSFVNFNNIL